MQEGEKLLERDVAQAYPRWRLPVWRIAYPAGGLRLDLVQSAVGHAGGPCGFFHPPRQFGRLDLARSRDRRTATQVLDPARRITARRQVRRRVQRRLPARGER